MRSASPAARRPSGPPDPAIGRAADSQRVLTDAMTASRGIQVADRQRARSWSVPIRFRFSVSPLSGPSVITGASLVPVIVIVTVSVSLGGVASSVGGRDRVGQDQRLTRGQVIERLAATVEVPGQRRRSSRCRPGPLAGRRVSIAQQLPVARCCRPSRSPCRRRATLCETTDASVVSASVNGHVPLDSVRIRFQLAFATVTHPH